uniref:DUF7083 domain-containing protein n=2 Tax=Lutzomyia longipalpis TaxID=7200 RepID=A0A1B0CM29_LUTLO
MSTATLETILGQMVTMLEELKNQRDTKVSTSSEVALEALSRSIQMFSYDPDQSLTFGAWFQRYASTFLEDGRNLDDAARKLWKSGADMNYRMYDYFRAHLTYPLCYYLPIATQIPPQFLPLHQLNHHHSWYPGAGLFMRPDDANVYTTLEQTLSSNPNVYFQRSGGVHPGMIFVYFHRMNIKVNKLLLTESTSALILTAGRLGIFPRNGELLFVVMRRIPKRAPPAAAA